MGIVFIYFIAYTTKEKEIEKLTWFIRGFINV